MFVKIFGFALAAGVIGTSLAMWKMGGRFQKVEAAAYAGKQRPWWFWMISVILIGIYIAAMVDFIGADKSWAGWVLLLLIPLGWAIKGALLVFNAKGRQTISSISGDKNWQKVALARLPVGAILAVLALLA